MIMATDNTLNTVSLDAMFDKPIGQRCTDKREAFENQLSAHPLGQAIKQGRQERYLTQAQLGVLVGVHKSAIRRQNAYGLAPGSVKCPFVTFIAFIAIPRVVGIRNACLNETLKFLKKSNG